MRSLLDFGALPGRHKDCFEQPLLLAVAVGHLPVANLLMERGALLEERNEKGYTPLMEATSKGNYEMVELLLCRGDINMGYLILFGFMMSLK